MFILKFTTKYSIVLTCLIFALLTINIVEANHGGIHTGEPEEVLGEIQPAGNTTTVARTNVPGRFGKEGVYGCTNDLQNSVGQQHAGGIFVPVSEEAVAYNTNILVYKECVLDGIAARVKEVVLSGTVKSSFNYIVKNHNGESAFIQSHTEFKIEIREEILQKALVGKETANICEPFKRNVRQAISRTHAQATRKPEDAYKCSVPDDQMERYIEFSEGRSPILEWDMFLMSQQPENNPLMIFANSLDVIATKQEEGVIDTYLGVENNYKPHKVCKDLPAGNGLYEEYCEIVTPAGNISNLVNRLQSVGLDTIINADEIDELMGSLLNNLQTEILTSVGGFAGVTNNSGSGSYLDRLSGDAAARARQEYTSAGSGFLGGALAVETAYSEVRKSSKEALESTARQIEVKEQSCWNGLVAQAKSDLIAEVVALACARRNGGDIGGTDEEGNCTIQGTATEQADVTNPYNEQAGTSTATTTATSTQQVTLSAAYNIVITARAADVERVVTLRRQDDNSFREIGRRISPLLRVVDETIDTSQRALAVLVGLQAGLLGSDTPGNTRNVLEQVDQLAASGVLHREADVFQAKEQHDNIVDAMEDSYTEVVEEWDAGWCRPETWREHIILP